MSAPISKKGPLEGVRIVELAAIGPLPYAAMLLGDMGAEILRIDREGGGDWPNPPIVFRNREAITLDLKSEQDRDLLDDAIARADVVLEGFRPGVMERLGFGPERLTARHPRLIYGRMTGWGQEGPMALQAGHDINYLALSGMLSTLGAADAVPLPPHNLLGDYAAGALFLVFGVVSALYEREKSGRGQVVDAAIVDGAVSMLAPLMGMAAAGMVDLKRHRNMLGGSAAPYYRCYACADGRFVAVGPLEAKFRKLMMEKLGAECPVFGADRPEDWPEDVDKLTALFKTRPRDAWGALFADTDACVTPVLDLAEAAAHPHMQARQAFIERDGLLEPHVAPRLSATPGSVRMAAPLDEAGGRAMLDRWRVGSHS